jgi:type II secretory pathway pseudopilin PulG
MTTNRTTRRGLSMVELMIALSVTALIGLATVGMLQAVTNGVDTRRDQRSTIIRANAAQHRLAAYINPSRCILELQGSNLALWFDDSRKSETVHISEVRWLRYHAAQGTITVHYLTFPNNMTELERAADDQYYPASSNWEDLFTTYSSHARLVMRSRTLVDGLSDVRVDLDIPADALDARHVTFELTFDTVNEQFTTIGAATIQHHRRPLF